MNYADDDAQSATLRVPLSDHTDTRLVFTTNYEFNAKQDGYYDRLAAPVAPPRTVIARFLPAE